MQIFYRFFAFNIFLSFIEKRMFVNIIIVMLQLVEKL